MPSSLVLITVDCLRADHAGFMGYSRPTTPFLDSLAKESVVFNNAMVAGAPTYYSFPAIMASRYPLALGRDVVGLAPGEPTLASALNDTGCATAAFVAGNPYLSRRFGYDHGFEHFEDFLDGEIGPLPGLGGNGSNGSWKSRWNRRLADLTHKLGPVGAAYDELYFQYCQRAASPAPESLGELRRFPAADVIVTKASEWLGEVAGRPFFLWLHLMDPHSPYYPPEDALRSMGGNKVDASRARYLNSYWNRADLGPTRLRGKREEVVALYDAGIRWVDTQLARLVEKLRALGVWEKCVFAVTADHGEEFLEHGGRYHPPAITPELTHVPLLVRAPRLPGLGRVERPFSLIHLGPTLLEAVGAVAPPEFRGVSQWSQRAGRGSGVDQAVVECVSKCTNPYRPQDRVGQRVLAVIESRYRLVMDFATGKEQLFDVESDPGQLRPLPRGAAPGERRRLLDAARHHIAESLAGRDPEARLAARLRNLRLECSGSETEPAGGIEGGIAEHETDPHSGGQSRRRRSSQRTDDERQGDHPAAQS